MLHHSSLDLSEILLNDISLHSNILFDIFPESRQHSLNIQATLISNLLLSLTVTMQHVVTPDDQCQVLLFGMLVV